MCNSLSPRYLSIVLSLIILVTACKQKDQQPPDTADSPSLEDSTGPQDLHIVGETQSANQTDQSGSITKTQSLPNLTRSQETSKAKDEEYDSSYPNSKETPSSPIQKLRKKAKSLFSSHNPTEENEQHTQEKEMQEQTKKEKRKKEKAKKEEKNEEGKKEKEVKKEQEKKEQKAREKEEKNEEGKKEKEVKREQKEKEEKKKQKEAKKEQEKKKKAAKKEQEAREKEEKKKKKKEKKTLTDNHQSGGLNKWKKLFHTNT